MPRRSAISILLAANRGLDGQYAAFGEMVEGEAALARLEAIPVGKSAMGEDSAPKELVGIVSARLVTLK